MTSKKAYAGNRRASRPAKKRAKPAVDTKAVAARRSERIRRQAQANIDQNNAVVIQVLLDEVQCIKRTLWPTGVPSGYYGSEEEE